MLFILIIIIVVTVLLRKLSSFRCLQCCSFATITRLNYFHLKKYWQKVEQKLNLFYTLFFYINQFTFCFFFSILVKFCAVVAAAVAVLSCFLAHCGCFEWIEIVKLMSGTTSRPLFLAIFIPHSPQLKFARFASFRWLSSRVLTWIAQSFLQHVILVHLTSISIMIIVIMGKYFQVTSFSLSTLSLSEISSEFAFCIFVEEKKARENYGTSERLWLLMTTFQGFLIIT